MKNFLLKLVTKEVDMRIITVDEVRKTIEAKNALAKTIRSSHEDTRNWKYLFDQLENPVKNRPVKPLPKSKINREIKYNFETEKFESRSVNLERGLSKKTVETKKMSATLLPANALITLFRHQLGDSLGILIDRSTVTVKYAFSKTVNSDTKPWLFRNNVSLANQPAMEIKDFYTSEETIKNQLRKNGNVPAHINEFLIRMQKKSLMGVFAYEDNLTHRMGALALQAYIFKNLNMIVPVFYFNEFGLRDYTVQQQNEDIKQLATLADTHPAKRYYDLFTAHQNQLQKPYADHYTTNSGVFSVDSTISFLKRAIDSDEYYNRRTSGVHAELYKTSVSDILDLLQVALKKHLHITPLIRVMCDHVNTILSSNPDKYNDSKKNIINLYHFASRYTNDLNNIPLFNQLDFLEFHKGMTLKIMTDVRKQSGEDYVYQSLTVKEISISTKLFMALYRPETLKISAIEAQHLLIELKQFEHDVCKHGDEKFYWRWETESIHFSDEKLPNEKTMIDLQLKLLLCIDSKNDIAFSFSYEDKRLLEKHYKNEIDKLDNLEALILFRSTLLSRPSLAYQRNPKLKKISALFSKQYETAIQINLMTLLDTKIETHQKNKVTVATVVDPILENRTKLINKLNDAIIKLSNTEYDFIGKEKRLQKRNVLNAALLVVKNNGDTASINAFVKTIENNPDYAHTFQPGKVAETVNLVKVVVQHYPEINGALKKQHDVLKQQYENEKAARKQQPGFFNTLKARVKDISNLETQQIQALNAAIVPDHSLPVIGAPVFEVQRQPEFC